MVKRHMRYAEGNNLLEGREGDAAMVVTSVSLAQEEHSQVGEGALAPGRAMRVAHVLSEKAKSDVERAEFAKPGELVDVSFVKGHSLSLAASRLLALMILAAGGDAWRPMRHRIRKADIRRGHKSNDRIGDMLEELHRTLFSQDDLSWRGKRAKVRFPLIQVSIEEVDDGVGQGDSGFIEWEFTPDARELIRGSETYAVLNRQAVLGFRSSYALRIYEIGALRLRRRQPLWRGDVTSLRAALGIKPESYTDFAQLRRKVLEVAKAEIDQLAHFTVDWETVTKGRKVVELILRFTPKDAGAQLETVDELSRHSTGRKARREGRSETIVETDNAAKLVDDNDQTNALKIDERTLVFPTGAISFGASRAPFYKIARDYGGGWDSDLIAQAYREYMGTRLESLRGRALLRSWEGFCKSFATRRGPPS